ncbi:transmembrane sensor [Sphingomonas zeicaulis]|uniref:FecR family protein n=1 Tax=Sphingomonas zeicaulis TaxID=1632740 RepID=UPI003D221121
MTIRSHEGDAIMDEALAWQAALARDDADWDGYIAWLEADQRHQEAYDAIDLIDAAVDAHRSEVRDVLEAPAAVRTARFWLPRLAWVIGGGIAAALAFLLVLPVPWATQELRSYAAEEHARTVQLANGTTVTLSPASSILVHDEQATRIELAQGEAYFEVRHDPSRTLTISAGPYEVTDIGTRFSINHTNAAFRVAVSEGVVSIASPRMETVRVVAGQQLVSAGETPRLSAVATDDVGSWRSGRLSYSNAPLSLVAADISRYANAPVIIDPSLENAHFSGSLVIGDGSKLVDDLATIIGARVVRTEGGVRLGAAAGR